MATRAEQFRYDAERTGVKQPKHVRQAPRSAGGSARSESAHAGRKATYLLEDAVGRPSRKSSRKASNRQRTDTKSQALRRIAEVRARPPPARAGRS
jgi:hypothetical protein